MEKLPRLLSSHLFQERRQLEVVLNRRVLAWRETETSKTPSCGISSLPETGESSMQGSGLRHSLTHSLTNRGV